MLDDSSVALRVYLKGQWHAFDLLLMDCDGVIFDMNPAKTEGFRYALDSYPATDVQRLVEYHHAYGGVSRYQKFHHFFSAIHPVEDVQSAKNQALSRYRDFVQEAYRTTPPVEEAMTFARRAREDGTDVHVVSGSDEGGLLEVFDYHGIRSHFDGVHGSPTGKPEHVDRLLKKTSTAPDRAVFIGDGWSDFEVSKTFEIQFVFLAECSEWPDALDHVSSWELASIVEDWVALLAILHG